MRQQYMYERFNHREDTAGLIWWILGAFTFITLHMLGIIPKF